VTYWLLCKEKVYSRF